LLRSFLQGANLGPATLSNPVSAAGAFVDFGQSGNIVDVYLSGANHNQFASATGEDICVKTYYLLPSTVPDNSANLTPCPDGSMGPCGSANWKSSLLKSATPTVPLFWYADLADYPPTFLPSWQNPSSGQKQIQTCNGIAATPNW
jgi:hypothetical protein